MDMLGPLHSQALQCSNVNCELASNPQTTRNKLKGASIGTRQGRPCEPFSTPWIDLRLTTRKSAGALNDGAWQG
jgi:hypothetical protein